MQAVQLLSEVPPQLSRIDKCLLEDRRVLKQLLVMEKKYIPTAYTEAQVQVDSGTDQSSTDDNVFTARRRCILVEWIRDVVRDRKLNDYVFFGAVSYIDRMMTHPTIAIQKCMFQLMGAACVWVASKMYDTHTVTAGTMCYLTDNTYTVQQLLSMETLVLHTLDWDLCAPTTRDFWDLILYNIPSSTSSYMQKTTRETLLSHMCYITTQLSCRCAARSTTPPSVVAAAAACIVISDATSQPRDFNVIVRVVGEIMAYFGLDEAATSAALDMIDATIADVQEMERDDLEQWRQLLEFMGHPDPEC